MVVVMNSKGTEMQLHRWMEMKRGKLRLTMAMTMMMMMATMGG